MRLICPNCDAEYEVDDNVIPDGGRDVQCSSCNKSWFQASANMPTQGSGAAEAAAKSVSESDPPKSTDANLDILREEAAREHQARRNEALGKPGTQPAPRTADKGPAQQSTPASGSAPNAPSGSELDPDFIKEIERTVAKSKILPDIEEVSSSLSAESTVEDVGTDDQLTEKKQRGRSFRMGFGLVLTIATFMVLAYIYAPLIVEKFPQSKSFMIGYVEVANDFRFWLDQMMKMATEKMSGGT